MLRLIQLILFLFTATWLTYSLANSPESNITTVTGTLTLIWDTPTTREDGTPLDPSEIKGYSIYIKQGSNPYKLLAHTKAVNEYPLPSNTACVKLSTTDTNNVSGHLSKEYCYSVPNPPSGYEIELNLKWKGNP